MLTEFEPFKQIANSDNIPYLYLLRNVSDKGKYAIVRIDNDIPTVINNSALSKDSSAVADQDWQKLGNSKKQVEKYLIDNLSIESIQMLENCFDEYDSDEELEKKTIIIDNYEE